MASCSTADAARGPSLGIAIDEPSARMLVDGRTQQHPSTLDYAYYGTREVRALPPPTLRATTRWVSTAEWVEVPPPVPKWLFPFDFVVECALWPWTPIADREVALRLAENPEPIASDAAPPRDLERLRSRANTARSARW